MLRDPITEIDRPFRRSVIVRASLSLGALIAVGSILRHWITPITNKTLIGNALSSVFLLSVPLLEKRKVSTRILTQVLLTSITWMGINSGLGNGGMSAPATAIFILNPIVGYFAGGKKSARWGMVLTFIGMAFLLWAERQGLTAPLQGIELYSRYKTLVDILLLVAIYGLGAAYENARRLSNLALTEISIKAAHSSKMASLGEISAGVAHEINNPLAIITGIALNLPKLRDNPEKFDTKIATLIKAANRIAKIVRGLKVFSRTGEQSSREVVRLSKVVAESINLASSNAELHLTRIKIRVETDAFISCNSIEIEQVLINLINNAVDAVLNLQDRWIEVSIHRDGELALLEVLDSGPGIPQEIAEKVFQPFFTTKPVGQGTGLGLSICKGILDQHGATISVRKNSSNTCFEIRFPIVAYQEVQNAA